MNNELVPKDITGGALTQHSFDDVVSSASTFLPRLQLYGSKTDACAEGKIGIGHWGLAGDDTIVDLGEDIDVVIVSWRPKALNISDRDNIITEYNPKSDLYQKVKELSTVKDSGCMYGPEFLLWIPSQNTFATYFANSKTARREAKKVEPLIGKAATFKVKFIDPPTSRFKWHGPVVVPCSTPLDVPSIENIQAEIDKFQNPPKSDVEIADDDGSDRER